MRSMLLFLGVALLTYVAASCAPKMKADGGGAAAPATKAAAGTIKAEPAPTGQKAAPPAPAAAPTTFAWTDKPTLDMVPGGPVKGELNGAPYEAKTVLIEMDTDSRLRRITISDKALASDTDLLVDDNEFSFEFPSEIKAGSTLTKALRDPDNEADAWYCYQQKDGSPMSINGDWAAAVSVDSGSDKGYDAKGDMVQVTGSFSGRIALCFEWTDSATSKVTKNWVAGTFENAKVRYWGAPKSVSGGHEANEPNERNEGKEGHEANEGKEGHR
jgi:hypothetical protein